MRGGGRGTAWEIRPAAGARARIAAPASRTAVLPATVGREVTEAYAWCTSVDRSTFLRIICDVWKTGNAAVRQARFQGAYVRFSSPGIHEPQLGQLQSTRGGMYVKQQIYRF